MKVGIFFSHYECFGHTSRVTAISQVFRKKFPSGNFFSIHGGIQQPMSQLSQNIKVYSLPFPYADKTVFRGSVPHPGAHAIQRAKVCTEIMDRELPDLFLTEFFPMGREECRHELIPSLIKASVRKVKIWAVAGYPLLLGTGQGWREKVLKLYQKIIIFAPLMEKNWIVASLPDEQTKQRYNDFFERNEHMIEFAGYLLPQGGIITYKGDVNTPRPPIPKGACRVTVVRGGGAVYPKIIAEAICASDVLGKEYYLTIVAGPSTSPDEWYLFSTLLAKKKIKNVVLLKAVVDYEGLIRDSDVCVATPSYHTSVMLMKYRKKAVLVPFEGYGQGAVFYEQKARAALLKENIGSIVHSITELTAMSLAESVRMAASQQSGSEELPQEWFMGADHLGKALTGLLPR